MAMPELPMGHSEESNTVEGTYEVLGEEILPKPATVTNITDAPSLRNTDVNLGVGDDRPAFTPESTAQAREDAARRWIEHSKQNYGDLQHKDIEDYI